MQFSDEFLEKWEHLINDVDITEVPLECIKKIVIKLENRRTKTINIQTLRRQGLNEEQLELAVNQILSDYTDQMMDLDFIVDVPAVAGIVQQHTDEILKGL
jgi:hypothetical protein